MSNGRTHEADSKNVAAVTAVVAGLATSESYAVAAAVIGCHLGVYLTPDLDVDGFTRSKRKAVWRGGVLGWLWFAFWLPYSKLIPHRHWVSHFPVVSTFIRLVYLSAIPTAMYVFYQPGWTIPVNITIWFFIGLSVSDTVHAIRDFW